MSPSPGLAFKLRALDLGLTLLSAPLWGPLLLLAMVVARVAQGPPVFFHAERVGRDGKVFRMLKVRTMLPAGNTPGPNVSSSADPRITPIGRFLRRTKLDEFPQFLHVLRGEMSIVGPRPESPAFLPYYTPAGRRALRAKPGLAGYGALYFLVVERQADHQEFERRYISDLLPVRLRLDECCWNDLQARPVGTMARVILLTLRAVLLRRTLPDDPERLAARLAPSAVR